MSPIVVRRSRNTLSEAELTLRASALPSTTEFKIIESYDGNQKVRFQYYGDLSRVFVEWDKIHGEEPGWEDISFDVNELKDA